MTEVIVEQALALPGSPYYKGVCRTARYAGSVNYDGTSTCLSREGIFFEHVRTQLHLNGEHLAFYHGPNVSQAMVMRPRCCQDSFYLN